MLQLPITYTLTNRLKVIKGQKTQTRRIGSFKKMPPGEYIEATPSGPDWSFSTAEGNVWMSRCYYGAPQDGGVEYWMREPTQVVDIGREKGVRSATIQYFDEDVTLVKEITLKDYNSLSKRSTWTRLTARYMRKSFARRWLTGKRTWPELLRNITPADAIAEGCIAMFHDEYDFEFDPRQIHPAIANYRRLWDEINDKDSPWSITSWIWALEFNLKED
jgi:hypothetical protein